MIINNNKTDVMIGNTKIARVEYQNIVVYQRNILKPEHFIVENAVLKGFSDTGKAIWKDDMDLDLTCLKGKITRIMGSAFIDCRIGVLTIPIGVQRIGFFAFSHEKIGRIGKINRIPESVTKIDAGAFNTVGDYLKYPIEIPQNCELGAISFPEDAKIVRY